MIFPRILLQTTRWTGFGDTPSSNTPALIGIGAAAGLIILIVVISRIIASRKETGSDKKYRPAVFRNQAKRLGLSDTHIRLLETFIKRYDITYPYNLFKNTPLLDETLGRAMQDMESSAAGEDAKSIQKQALFRIKQIIEFKSQKKKTISSTKQLKVNQALVLAPSTGGRYKSRIVSVLPEALSVEAPLKPDGKLAINKRWQALTVYFWKEAGSAYTFATKVTGFKPVGSIQTLLLQHAKKVELSQQRKYRRKEVDKPAYFYRIDVIESGRGRNKKKEAVVDFKGRGLGTIVDISSGGCSVKTNAPLQKGALVKIQFEPVRKHMVTAFGKVRQISRRKPSGFTMHVMFTKISRQNMNDINEYIYDLAEALR